MIARDDTPCSICQRMILAGAPYVPASGGWAHLECKYPE